MSKIERISLKKDLGLTKTNEQQIQIPNSNSTTEFLNDVVNDILGRNNIVPLRQKKEYTQDELREQVADLKERNAKIQQTLLQYNISDKDIDDYTDQRNVLQKFLGLKDNQGVLFSVLELLNRPAEALQGAIASTFTSPENILQNIWKGFSGQKEYTINDLGLNLQDPLVSAAFGIVFEVGVDPLNFLDKPLRLFAQKSGGLAKGVLKKLEKFAGKSELGDAIVNKAKEFVDRTEIFFKKTFGNWSDTKAQEHINDVSTLRHDAIRLQNQGQILVKQIYDDAGDVSNQIITALNKGTLDDGIRSWLTKEVKVPEETLFKLQNPNNKDFVIGKEDLTTRLNTYYGRLIEEHFHHGYTVKHFFEEMLDEGIVEVAAKTEAEVKGGNIYNKLKEFFEHALRNPSVSYYDIEDLVVVEKEVSNITHLGRKIFDANGNAITNISTSRQGFRIKLTPIGLKILRPYWNNIVKTQTVQKFLNHTDISIEQKFLTDLITNGESFIGKLDSASLKAYDDFRELYYRTTNKKLEVIKEDYLGGFKLSFAPSRTQFNEYQKIKKRLKVIKTNEKTVIEFFKPLNNLYEYKIPRIQNNINDNNQFLLDYINANKKQYKIDVENIWEQDNTFKGFVLDGLFGDGDTLNAFKALNNKTKAKMIQVVPSQRSYARYNKDFANSISDFNRRAIKGIHFDVSTANRVGYHKSVRVEFDFKAFSAKERINIVAYLIANETISVQDLINLGVRSFTHFDDGVLLNRLNNLDLSVVLKPEKTNDFINAAALSSKHPVTKQTMGMSEMVNNRIKSIIAGDLLQNKTLLQMQEGFSITQSIDAFAAKFVSDGSEVARTINNALRQNKHLQNVMLRRYQAIGEIVKNPDYQKFKMYKDFFENDANLDNTTLVELAYYLDNKGVQKEDFDFSNHVRNIEAHLTNRINSVEKSISRINSKIKKYQQYFFSSNYFTQLARNFDRLTAGELVNDLLRYIDTVVISKNDQAYITLNNLNQLIITNEPSTQVLQAKIDFSTYKSLRDFNEQKIRLKNQKETLEKLETALYETQLVLQWDEFPEFRFNTLELSELLYEMKLRWNTEIIEEIVSDAIIPLERNQKLLGKNKKLQEIKLRELNKEKQLILDDIKYIDDNNIEGPEAYSKKSVYRERLEQIDILINQTTQRINSLDLKEMNVKPKPVTKFSDDVLENATNNNWKLVDSLSGASSVERSIYVEDLKSDLKIINELLQPNKIDSLRTLSSLGGYDTAYNKIPQVFQNTIQRIVDVQFTIHNSIARNFKHHFGIDMTNWGVNGYLRHMLAPEMANIAMITNTIQGRLSGVASEFFGNSAKKVAMFREYQASAADVNMMKANELFNTNPIEATAIALELLPRHFHLGGVFKSMIERGLIKKVPLAKFDVSETGANALKKKLLIELETINSGASKTKGLTLYQKQKAAVVENEIKIVDEYLDALKQKQEFVDTYLPDKLSDEDMGLLETLNARRAELIKLREQALADNTNVKTIEQELRRIKIKISKITRNYQTLDNLPVELRGLYDTLDAKLSAAAQKLSSLQAKGFNGRDSWLKDLPGFGKEYMWVTKDVFTKIQEAFEIVSKASGEFDAIYKSEWGKSVIEILKDFEVEGATYAMHRSVYDGIIRLSKRSVDKDGELILKTLEKLIIKPFKQISVATVGFHIRNIFTNLSNAYLAGFNPADMVKEMHIAHKELQVFNKALVDINRLLSTGRFRDAESQIKMFSDLVNKGIKIDGIDIPFDATRQKVFNEFFTMLEKGVIGNNHFSDDLATFVREIRSSAYGYAPHIDVKKFHKYVEYSSDKFKFIMNKLFDMSKNADDIAKIAMYRLLHQNKYLHLLDDTYNTAEKYVKFVLFDYNNLTHTEETIMKTLFPFYTWARKNFEFQMKNFFRLNKRYRWLHNALRGWRQGLTLGLDENDYNEQYFPIWNDDGKITYVKIQLEGLLAADEILLGTGIVNALTPLLKAPIEMITGYDFFTKKSFNDGGQFYGFGLGLTNLVKTFDIVQRILIENYTPTYDEKKVAGVIGKKLIQLAQISKGLFAYGANPTLEQQRLWGVVVNTFPSVFSQDNLYQLLYFQQRERNELMYKILNSVRR